MPICLPLFWYRLGRATLQAAKVNLQMRQALECQARILANKNIRIQLEFD